MGLFEDIWNWMKSLVQALINKSLETFKFWVNKAIQSAIDAVNWVITNVYNFIDNSINYIDESINYWGDQITQYITNVQNTYNQFITNVNNTYNDFITNVTNVYNQYTTNNTYQTIQHITNIIGVLDPLGFLKDPRGYITGVFNLLIAPWSHGLVKSFTEGFEEGLEE